MALCVRVPPAAARPAAAVLDEAMLRQAASVLLDPRHGVQLAYWMGEGYWLRQRLPAADLDGLTAAVAQRAAVARGIYWAIAPIDPALSGNMRTGDALYRRWLLVDVDPVRPKGVSATAQEHEAAQARAYSIHDDLCRRGWPAPVLYTSGNGYHLLYRIDLPNDAASRQLVAAVLRQLSRQHSDSHVVVDTAVAAANAQSRLPGTWARKGEDSPERPWRLCRLLHLPAEPLVVPPELLEELAGPRPAAAPAGHSFRLRVPGAGTAAYARAALERELGRIELAGQRHEMRNVALNRAAFALYQLVAGGVLDDHEVEQRLLAAALAAGLPESEALATLRSARTAGLAQPRGVPDRGTAGQAEGGAGAASAHSSEAPGANGSTSAGQTTPPPWRFTLDGEVLLEGSPFDLAPPGQGPQVSHVEMLTLAVNLASDFPEPRWAVPGILSEGLNILAGAPKKGKSILAFNLALTLAGGGRAMDCIQLTPMDVLYLSLEDRHRRLQDRARKMLSLLRSDLAEQAGRRLTLATLWPRLDQGGLEAVELWRKRAPAAGMVIIDTWARFSPQAQPTRSAYAQDSKAMALLQHYAHRHGLTLLIIHHTRKSSTLREPDDHVQEVSGTLGLSGVADGILVLIRAPEEYRATLHVTGRDVSDQDYVLELDPQTLVWRSLGTKASHIQGRVQQKVVEHLRHSGRAEFVRDIAEAIGEKEESVRVALHRLRQQHVIRRVGNAWSYPGDSSDAETF